LTASGITLTAAGYPSIALRAPSDSQPRTVQIWDDEVTAVAGDPAVDQWLSNFLNEPCHLAWMAPTCHRPVNAEAGNEVSFADGYPCLIISEASLADLNDRLATPLPMNRFRPNLVVSGCDAFAEDTWTSFSIGEARFRAISPCARCLVTTVAHSTGLSLAPEPLRTLATYRQVEKGVIFGINLIVEQTGRIQIDDSVQIHR